MDNALWLITAVALLASFSHDRAKTVRALKTAAKRMLKIAPLFLTVMALYALVVTFFSQSVISRVIGAESGWSGMLSALIIGSVALMPGFVAFPLCALLREQGAPFFILAAFSMALMNVGILTFPLEQKFLGWRVALIRNLIGLLVALLCGLIMGLAFGEFVQ